MAEPPPLERPSALPWWTSALLGTLCVGLGVFLALRPFTSLSVLVVVVGVTLVATGVSVLAANRGADHSAAVWVTAAAWILAGVLAWVWPGLTTRGIAVIAGMVMIMGGAIDVASGFRGRSDERAASVIWGTASGILGVLALAWPDVTLLVVAVVFGVRTAVFGGRLILNAVRSRHGVSQHEPHEKGLVRRGVHVLGVSVMLVVALALASLSWKLHATTSNVDGFYTAPTEVPDEPGQLLRSEPFTRAVPENGQAWRILYTTTRDDGVPAVASGLVVVPKDRPAPLPVIAWAHGTTGVDPDCAPSVVQQPFEAGAFFLLEDVVDHGWAFVGTDYVGLGTEGPHPYLIGQGEGRSVLDAVRAARQLPDLQLADETVVWGHSQGGNAALWTGVIAPTYAPDVPLAGVAALAPASDVIGLAGNLENVTGGSIFASYVIKAYTDSYPDVRVEDYVKPAARTTFVETAKRCLDGSAIASALGATAIGFEGFADDLTQGPIRARFEQNTPRGRIQAPLLVGQGAADSLVVPDVQRAFVDQMCAAGQQVDFRMYEGRDHVPLVQPDSPLVPELIEWTQDRLDGRPPRSTCPAS